MEEKLIYEDEQNIAISDTAIYSGDRKFPLKSIRRILFRRKSAFRVMTLFLFLSGLFAILSSSLQVMGTLSTGLKVSIGPLDTHLFLMALGLLAFALGIVFMVHRKDYYSVSILTDTGKIKLLVTSDREYAAKVTGILMKVYHRFIPNSSQNRLTESILF